MNRLYALVVALLVSALVLSACAPSQPPTANPGYADGGGGGASSSNTSGDNGGAPITTVTATLQGAVKQGDTTATAMVLCRAGSIEAAERAGRLKAAREAVGSMALDSLDSDEAWPAAAISNTQSTIKKKQPIPGGIEATLQVTVYQKELIKWAQDHGHGRMTDRVSGDVPAPEIMIVPQGQAGKWPERLSDEESRIYSACVSFLQDSPRNLRTSDYETYWKAVQGELANATGMASQDENYLIGGDVYFKYEWQVHPKGGGKVNCEVTVHAVSTVTADNIARKNGFSGEISSSQQYIGLEQATKNAISQCYESMLQTWNRDYNGGVAFRIMLSGMDDDNELDISVMLKKACTQPLMNKKYADGVMECIALVKPELADPDSFRVWFRNELGDMGYKLINNRPRSRFIYGQVTPK